MTELEAVNRILSGAGFDPVSTLDAPNVPEEALKAKTALNETTDDLLSEDWKFNTEFDLEVEPDGNGELVLDGVIYAEFSESDEYEYRPVLRGTKVYNRNDRTYVFTDSMTLCKVVSRLTWDEAPDALQRYIVKVAENDFVMQVLGDDLMVRHSEKTLQEAYGRLNKYRARTTPTPLIRVPGILDRRAQRHGSRTSRMAFRV
jgi:hypothetical protein